MRAEGTRIRSKQRWRVMHSFDPDVAVKVGVNAAILYANISWWCAKNQANGRNVHEGLAWTYNSVKAWSELFPYLSAKQIRSALLVLEDEGLIVSGEFNESSYDRTKWYSPSGKLDLPCRATQLAPEGKPIPVIKPDINLGREEEALSAYNSMAERAGLSKAQTLTPKRRSSLKKRLEEVGGLDGWIVALEKVEQSDFLTGKRPTNNGPFHADLDFILQQSSFTRLMEGFYDNRSSSNQHSARNTGASRAVSNLRAGFQASAADDRNGDGAGSADYQLPF